jgi:hypothetical protein
MSLEIVERSGRVKKIQEGMGFLSLPSSPELLQRYSKKEVVKFFCLCHHLRSCSKDTVKKEVVKFFLPSSPELLQRYSKKEVVKFFVFAIISGAAPKIQ